MHSQATTSARATGYGVLAILLWSGLALLTTFARGIPPVELLALSFSVAFVLGVAVLAVTGRLSELHQPAAPWFTAFAAIFFYHLLYFFALSYAPAAQASLINYLWPLLIVVFSSLRRASPARVWGPCIAGGLLGFVGTGLVLTEHGLTVRPAYLMGYAAAFCCAFVWSGYSVFNRRFAATPSGMLVGVCGAVALAAFALHGAVEIWVTPNARQWGAIVALGAGPTGLAFFAWDHATKRGHVTYLGILSYLAPLLSTALLMATGAVERSSTLLIAAAFIMAGAAVPKAAEYLWPKR